PFFASATRNSSSGPGPVLLAPSGTARDGTTAWSSVLGVGTATATSSYRGLWRSVPPLESPATGAVRQVRPEVHPFAEQPSGRWANVIPRSDPMQLPLHGARLDRARHAPCRASRPRALVSGDALGGRARGPYSSGVQPSPPVVSLSRLSRSSSVRISPSLST